MKSYINHIFNTDSSQLNAYLTKYPVGKAVGDKWKVVEVNKIEVPPHPDTGDPCTNIIVVLDDGVPEPEVKIVPPFSGPLIAPPQ